MLHTNVPPPPAHEFSTHIIAALIVLAVGIIVGWVLHHRMPKTKKNSLVVRYDFDEADVYYYDHKKISHK